MDKLRRTDDTSTETDREAPEGVREERAVARGPEHDRDVHALQRDRFGGFTWGAIFFGWLVAVGLAALLTAILSAAGTAIGITELSAAEAEAQAETLGLIGGILLVVVLALSYFAGGYVAGRLARFDGARQGFGVWIFGLLVTLAAAAFAAIAGSEWNVFAQLDLPRIPIDEGTLTTGGGIALAAIVIGTLLAAIFGGKVGERFHLKVDRAAFEHRATR